MSELVLSMVETISRTMALRDKYTAFHQRNVAFIAVADTYDAMASDRPYRKALGVKKAHKTILQGKKSLFDEKVVDLFNQYYQQDATFGGRYKV